MTNINDTFHINSSGTFRCVMCCCVACDQAHGRVRHAENRPGDESDSSV